MDEVQPGDFLLITLTTPEIITLVIAFLGMLGSFGWILLVLFTKQIDKQFAALDLARAEAGKHWDDRFNALDLAVRENERETMRLRAELPNEYVRREDWIRFSGTIDSKLDRVHAKLDNLGSIK